MNVRALQHQTAILCLPWWYACELDTASELRAQQQQQCIARFPQCRTRITRDGNAVTCCETPPCRSNGTPARRARSWAAGPREVRARSMLMQCAPAHVIKGSLPTSQVTDFMSLEWVRPSPITLLLCGRGPRMVCGRLASRNRLHGIVDGSACTKFGQELVSSSYSPVQCAHVFCGG